MAEVPLVETIPPDWYGRFAISYPFLCNWLAPGCNATQVDGYDPNTPTVALDAQLVGFVSPTGSLCSSNVTPQLTLRNAGSNTLTSVTIDYAVDGTNYTYNWSGSLASGNTTVITLSSITLGGGNYTITASASNPNGGTDENPANDDASSAFAIGTNVVDIDIVADRYGAETTWEIVDGSGNVVGSGGPYTTVGTNGEYPQPTESVCLANGCYTFTIFDSYGDGICCAYGNGTYTITDDSGTVLTSGGAGWTTSESSNFCVESTVLGCTDAMACNYNANANQDDGSCVSPDIYYADTDNDGYGDPASSTSACSQPAGYVSDNTDCDDTLDIVYPGAAGTGEDIDNNCNGSVEGDESSFQPCFADFNGDLYVNVSDLLMLLSAFGCDGDCITGDLNGDNKVDGSDMVVFLAAFGSDCN